MPSELTSLLLYNDFLSLFIVCVLKSIFSDISVRSYSYSFLVSIDMEYLFSYLYFTHMCGFTGEVCFLWEKDYWVLFPHAFIQSMPFDWTI